MKYTKIALQLAVFSKNNCLQKSDWLRLNVAIGTTSIDVPFSLIHDFQQEISHWVTSQLLTLKIVFVLLMSRERCYFTKMLHFLCPFTKTGN